jgi:hypothetical protein
MYLHNLNSYFKYELTTAGVENFTRNNGNKIIISLCFKDYKCPKTHPFKHAYNWTGNNYKKTMSNNFCYDCSDG